MYSQHELQVLNKIAQNMYGCNYNDLDSEEQDEVYCYAEDNGFFDKTVAQVMQGI